MATYEITAPDGNVYEITAPDGASESDVLDYAKKNYAGSAATARPSVQQPQAAKTRGFIDLPEAVTNPSAESIAGDPLVRFAVGAGKSLVGGAQLANRYLLGEPVQGLTKGIDWIAENIKRTEQIGKEQLKQRGEVLDVAGTVGEAMNPVGLGATKLMKPTASFSRWLTQAGGLGGLYSVLQPYTGDKGDIDIEKLKDAVVGFGLGVITQGALIEPAKYGLKMVQQFFTEQGARNVSKQYLERILGKGNLEKIVADVESQLPSVGKGPVSGYRPTLGELVAERPEAGPLLALQARTAQTSGGPSAKFAAKDQANTQAIRSAIESFAGTPAQLKSAVQVADENAAANYGPLMGRRVSPESDVGLLMRQIQEARGVPWRGAAADIGSAAPVPTTHFAPTGVQPDFLTGTMTGRAGAMQQWGKAATDEAVQTGLANRWTPVPGMPRVAARYSPNAEVAEQANAAAREALYAAGTRGKEAEFIETMLGRLDRAGMLAREDLNPMVARPSMARAIDYAQKMAAERGYSFPKSASDDFTVQNLHDMKLGLDAQIRAGSVKNQPTSLDNATLSAIQKTKDTFVGWIEKKVPAYEKARLGYARDMTPVNQMQVGQALLEKLRAPTGVEAPGSYLRAIDDETKLIRNVTGQPRQELGQVLNPRQTETVGEVGRLLENRLASLSPVRRASLPGGGDIAKQIGFELPSILSRPVVIANWLIKTASKGSSPLERRVDQINAFWMLHPDKFVEAMKTMSKPEKNTVMGVLTRGSTIGSAATGLNELFNEQ